MRFTSLEEFGLRILLQMASKHGEPQNLEVLARSEGLGRAYTAKIMGALKKSGLVESERGQFGGYSLVQPPHKTNLRQVLEALDGPFYTENLCGKFSGLESQCVHTQDCSIRTLWKNLSAILGLALESLSLADLLGRQHGRQGQVSRMPDRADCPVAAIPADFHA